MASLEVGFAPTVAAENKVELDPTYPSWVQVSLTLFRNKFELIADVFTKLLLLFKGNDVDGEGFDERVNIANDDMNGREEIFFMI